LACRSRSGKTASQISYPARLFRSGLPERVVVECDPFERGYQDGHVLRRVDLHTVRERTVIAFGGLALAVILIGLALGALLRRSREPQPIAPPPAAPPPTAPPT
jgi:hypothetical protein